MVRKITRRSATYGKLQALGKFVSQGDVFGDPRLSIFIDDGSSVDIVDMVVDVQYS